MRSTLFVALALPLLAACRGREDGAGTAAGSSGQGNVEAPIPAGETMRIRTTDRVFELALRNDSVVLSLSGQALSKVKRALDSVATDTATKTMVGSLLTRTLKSGAERLAAQTSGFSIRDMESATYENGRLEFRLGDGKQAFSRLDQIKEGGRPMMEAFAPADARRFVDAVRAAKSSG